MSLGFGFAFTRASTVGLAPSLNLQFAGATALDPRVTFTRASTATYFNSAGVLSTAAINTARFDYNPSTKAAQGLLIEEQRTNLFLQSQFASGWTFSNASFTGTTTAPDGTNTGQLLNDSSAAAAGYVYQGVSVTSGTAYSWSCFAKASGRTDITFSSFTQSGSVTFTLTGAGSAGTPTGTLSNATITLLSNGWYRCTVTFTANATGNNNMGFNTNQSAYTGDAWYIWGAQLEAGAFPTSYIPTTNAAATRSQDRAVVSTLAPWFNATTGTIYAEFALTQPASGANQFLARFSDNSYNNSIADNIPNNGFAQLATASGGVFDGVAGTSPAVSANTVAKFAGAYASNDLAAAINAGTVATDNTATIPSGMTRFDLGSDHAGANNIKAGYLRRITYYPVRLANASLQALTA